MEGMQEIPELAIKSFEKMTGLSVTVHDITGFMWAFLSPGRFMHNTPCCSAVKSERQPRCAAFDIDRVHLEMPRLTDGCVKLCHAGLVEWSVPLFRQTKMECIVFAGQRVAGPDLHPGLIDPALNARARWPYAVKLPPPVSHEESKTFLELLRQLVARLKSWRDDYEAAESAVQRRRGRRSRVHELVTRRAIIFRYIRGTLPNPIKLADLAKELHISESRAGHAIKEACGKSFIKLVTEARLRQAAGLLRHSSLAVPEIASRSGFGDLSHFHHIFRRHFKTTPHRYRKQAEAAPQ
jgi:AraC-like DNA-binding protein